MKKLVCVLIAAVVLVGSGCGDSGLAASSTCRDFVDASPEAQAEAISQLSGEFETPEYNTPLGSPEVGYYCAGNPDTTLEEFFQRAHESEG
jgi:hypothetical protein